MWSFDLPLCTQSGGDREDGGLGEFVRISIEVDAVQGPNGYTIGLTRFRDVPESARVEL